ncbi:BlaI/MecI/CopY family transcriptional regulator [Streptomyces rishiriensis]|uniref:BlaI/MecI/CopY family transcriptional regulator n=1 Tax=Streptomyces rishiriensis TaxID=68264 RepID=UPI000D58D543|nr:BlaI/MecI/CopY family transcriptional regulator [Streptomyces rishiriensis]
MEEREGGGAREPSGRRARGELESDVLAALWSADGPLTAGQVREALPGDLAYTTVLTILSRLYDKEMLVRHREGRGYAYEPVRDEPSHTAQRMRSLLEGGSDREAVLARFVSELSEQDEHVLHRLLSEHDARTGDDRSAGRA